MRKSYKIALLMGAMVGAIGANAAQAQDAPEAADQGSVVGEVIVTAQKRNERLQDVPVAVSVASADQLEALNVSNVIDLRVAAPSLNSNPSNGQYLANSIRGVGSFGYGAGVESPVSLYIDGVYQAFPFVYSTQLNNIASVEVLKGPQGTLFGRNATGGLINIATRTPTDDFTGRFSASYGNYDTWEGAAYIAGGIAPNLAADIAIYAKAQGDGFGTNRFNGEDVYRTDYNYTLRSKVVWTPSEDTTATLIGTYFDFEGTPGATHAWPGKIRSAAYGGGTEVDLKFDANVNRQLYKAGEGAGISLKVEHDFGNVTFSSISAYQRSFFHLFQDLDWTANPIQGLLYEQRDDAYSQELQLSSKGDSRLQWVAGLFYFDSRSKAPTTIINGPTEALNLNFDDTVGAKSAAAYAQGTYEIAPETHLTLGGRYTTEKRTEKDPVNDLRAFGLPLLIGPDQKSTVHRFNYRVSLDHRFSEALLGYASISTGFKSGGFNAVAPATPGYGPEKLTAYEVGFKSDLFDRRLRLNLAGYYYDYSGIQVQGLDITAIYVFNGSNAKIYGIDADFTAILGGGFSLTGGFNLLHNKFGDFPNCPTSQPQGGVRLVPGNCRGNQLPMAADFTGALALNYKTDLGQGVFDASVNLYYNSGFYTEADNVLRQGAYHMLGASAKWTAPNGFSVGVFGRNLTDELVSGGGSSNSGGNTNIVYQDPRIYGVTLGYEF